MSCRSLTAAWLATVLVGIAACHNSDKYIPLSPDNPDGTDLTKVLAIDANPATVPADGVSRTKITARIDPTSTVRKISFSTTLGTLYGGGKVITSQTGTLDVDADSNGTATVDLQTTATVATAKVTASIKPSDTAPPIVRVIDVPFSTPVADQVMTLATSAATIPADGFSTVTITATVTVAGDKQQQVTFATSRGTLVKFGAGSGDPGTVVTADASGIARIQLRSDSTVGTARVSAKALGFEREVFVEFTAINPSDVITVRPDADTLPADGFSRTRIVARVSASIPDSGTNRVVTFTTTDGSFITPSLTPQTSDKSVTVKADASNLAIAEIKSPTLPVTAGITATVANVTARTSIVFTKATPNTVFVESSAASVAVAGVHSVTFTVTLLRDVGTTASDQVVTWEARDAGGNAIGSFFEVKLAKPDPNDSTGKTITATAKFDPDDTAVLGTATITARVAGVAGTVTITLNP